VLRGLLPAFALCDRQARVAPALADAIALLKAQSGHNGATDLIFPGMKLAPLSDISLSAVMKRMKVDTAPHGLRSTFRQWATQRTPYPREVAEHALAQP